MRARYIIEAVLGADEESIAKIEQWASFIDQQCRIADEKSKKVEAEKPGYGEMWAVHNLLLAINTLNDQGIFARLGDYTASCNFKNGNITIHLGNELFRRIREHGNLDTITHEYTHRLQSLKIKDKEKFIANARKKGVQRETTPLADYLSDPHEIMAFAHGTAKHAYAYVTKDIKQFILILKTGLLTAVCAGLSLTFH